MQVVIQKVECDLFHGGSGMDVFVYYGLQERDASELLPRVSALRQVERFIELPVA